VPVHRIRQAYTLIELLVVLSVVSILAAILFPVFALARESARQSVCLSNTRQLVAAALLYTQDYDEKLPVLGTGIDGRGRWMFQIKGYVKSGAVFTCPHLPGNQYDGTPWSDICGYGWAEELWGKKGVEIDPADGYSLAEIGHASQTILLGDTGYDRVSGWAMYRRPPWLAESGGIPGFYAQFRHHATKVRTDLDITIGSIPATIDGLCTFAFVDGHAKALHAAAAFETATARDGAPLAGDDQYLLWTRF